MGRFLEVIKFTESTKEEMLTTYTKYTKGEVRQCLFHQRNGAILPTPIYQFKSVKPKVSQAVKPQMANKFGPTQSFCDSSVL